MILISIYLILILGVSALFFSSSKSLFIEKSLAILSSSIALVLTTYLLFLFDGNLNLFQSVTSFSFGYTFLNLNFLFGFDGISILFFFFKQFSYFFVYFIYLE